MRPISRRRFVWLVAGVGEEAIDAKVSDSIPISMNSAGWHCWLVQQCRSWTMERMPHRKTVKHYEDVITAHELTFSCYHRMPLLTNDVWRKMLGESISAATERHRFKLAAFVFMPEHAHLLVLPTTLKCSVSSLLKAIKRPYSYRIKQLLIQNNSHLLQRLTVHQRPGVTTFRYWQEGPGYDRNLDSPPAIKASINYIHLNPVRRGLCEKVIDWKWSSARYYHDPNYVPDPDLPRIDGITFDLLE